MEGPPLGPGGEDITWPDQVAPRGQKASSTRKIKPQTSNLRSRMQTIVDACGCHASKQSDKRDRGLISSLPIPYCANSLLYVDVHPRPTTLRRL